LNPQALEIESVSLARALIDAAETPTLISDIGARTANFSVFDEKGLKLSISITAAGNKFTKAISEKLNISLESAENLKKEAGLNSELKEGKVFLILQKELQEIIKEIKKIKEYFKNKTGKSIGKIVLAGGSAVLPELKEYLAENLEMAVEIGDPWLKINIDILKKKEYFKKALEINPIFYSTCIGSALRGLSKTPQKDGINLLPR
jgi:type IV pilus assembly protein PilM